MRPLIRLLLIAIVCLAIPASAEAATPFTAGDGGDPSVAVGSDGTGHVVWETDAANTQVGYCRVSSEATSCNRTEILSFPGSTEAQGAGKAEVFTPAPEKVVIVAGCWLCPTGTENRIYRWISTNNGASFSSPTEIGTGPDTNGRGAWLDDVSIYVGTTDSHVKAAVTDLEPGVLFASGGLFVYGPEVARVQGTTKLVTATNDLAVVKYGVYNGSPLSAVNINKVANWEVDKTLPSPEPDNSNTAVTMSARSQVMRRMKLSLQSSGQFRREDVADDQAAVGRVLAAHDADRVVVALAQRGRQHHDGLAAAVGAERAGGGGPRLGVAQDLVDRVVVLRQALDPQVQRRAGVAAAQVRVRGGTGCGEVAERDVVAGARRPRRLRTR